VAREERMPVPTGLREVKRMLEVLRRENTKLVRGTLAIRRRHQPRQAQSFRRTRGTLKPVELTFEAGSAGRRLMTRRASVRCASALWGRTNAADRVDLRLHFRTVNLQAGSLGVPRLTPEGLPGRTPTPAGPCLYPFAWFFHRGLAGVGFSASAGAVVPLDTARCRDYNDACLR
jgi:hypothetical protein